ncbi:MAG: ATP-binding protein, partial [Magnetococcus sp. WYHC-3]
LSDNERQALESRWSAITVEQGLDWTSALNILAGMLLLLGVTLLWIRRLRREIRRRQAAESTLQHTVRTLEEERALLSALMDAVPDVIAYKSMEGRYLGCNKAFEELFGLRSRDLAGRLDTELFDAQRARDCMDMDAEVRMGGPRQRLERFRNPVTGRLTLLETFKTLYATASEGAIGIVSIGRDITAHHDAQMALMASEERFRSIFENVPVAILVTDAAGMIQDVNAYHLASVGGTHRSREQSLGQCVLEGGPWVEAGITDLFRSVLTGQSLSRERVRYQDPITGASGHFNVRGVPILREGHLEGAMFIHEDITLYQEREDQLEQANRAKSDFLATMSHEIRTPMNVVLGMAELLLESTLSAEQRDYADRIHRSGGILLDLINDILDLSRLEAGEITLHPQVLPLAPFLESVREMMSFVARRKGLEFHLEVDKDSPPRCEADFGRLRQVLINLIGNAIKFTDQGRVTVRARRHPHAAVAIVVQDTGIGIPQNELERIFEKFHQVDSGMARQFGGSGLGLAICHHLVQRMGGSIVVESTLGSGSSFQVLLPEHSPGVTPVPQESAQVTPPPLPKPGIRILLVEDSEDNRLLMRAFLKNTACEMVMAINGREAVERVCGGEEFDLVLMDMQMPVMDGYQATRTIREWEQRQEHRRMPILALTAHALDGDVEMSLAAGCDGHLTKPLRKDVLLKEIVRHTGGEGLAPVSADP